MRKTSSLIDKIGIIISENNSPSTFNFTFLMTKSEGFPIQQGHFCYVVDKEHKSIIVGRIESLNTRNQYFQDIQTIKNLEINDVSLGTCFPVDEWECTVGQVKILGLVPIKSIDIGNKKKSERRNQIYKEEKDNHFDPKIFKHVESCTIVVNPGQVVYLMDGLSLQYLLGMGESCNSGGNGLHIGRIKSYDLEVRLDITKLFRKHLAILAQSGAGKSYLLSVILEELISRPSHLGTPASILIDVHGEYNYLIDSFKPSQDQVTGLIEEKYFEMNKRIHRYSGSFLQIGVPELTEYDFKKYLPNSSGVQIRELGKIITRCKKRYYNKDSEEEEEKPNCYGLREIIIELKRDTKINSSTQKALINWLYDLETLHVFGKYTTPSITDLARVGELNILDFSSLLSMKKKQILLEFFTKKLFWSRRNGIIPPFILFLEEAHQFIPEKGSKYEYAKGILEKIAREGRKFFAQLVLISQRPVHLSSTILSQCNTQIIMRITNPYDLKHIKATSEALTDNAMKIINTLPTGNAIIMGNALNYPILFEVRERILNDLINNESLCDVCQRYMKIDKSNNIRKSEIFDTQRSQSQSELI